MGQHHRLTQGSTASPPATIKEAQNKIEALTGIKRSETQVWEFLKKTPSPIWYGDQSLKISRQSSREIGGWHLLTSTRVLA